MLTAAGGFGRYVGQPEYNSWNNSCQHVKNLVDLAGLNDNMISLEYEVPYNTGRIDCLLFGRGQSGKAYAVLIELKQWSEVEELDDEDNFVETYTGGASRRVPHPAQQVEGYHNHLINFVQIFELDPDYDLFSCAYCHNYHKEENRGLFAPRYRPILEQFPVYTKEDVAVLADRLKILLAKGDGFEIFNRFMQSPIRPSRKLLDHVSSIIENKPVFSLLNEQLVAKNLIMSKVRKATRSKTKSVVIVHGGPGTGKTVIALNILAELAKAGKTVFYGCKSQPFREALMNKLGRKGSLLVSNLSKFVPNKFKENELDVIIVDEAHRIEKTSNSQYTRKEDRTNMPQVEQLVRCAKTTVFFIDDKQNVRSREVGSTELIRSVAKKYSAECEGVELFSQFRCNGSNNYLTWIEDVFGYTNEKRVLRMEDNFDFKIVDSPEELRDFIKAHESNKPNSARMVAGYCWPWSDPDSDGELVKDVVIGDFAMPWEAKDVPGLKRGTPRWYHWAFKTEAVDQVGCIYTAQGFEFDYVGVIIGSDLKYDKAGDRLVGNIEGSCDPTLTRGGDGFEQYVKNIYRVLMTRGMKGCYVYFVDKEVEAFFRSRVQMESVHQKPLFVADIVAPLEEERFKLEESVEKQLRHKEYLPVFTLEAACGYFGQGVEAAEEGWLKVDGLRLNKNMFISKIVGKSMEPLIPDGSYCVFQSNVVGSRVNKIVLVQRNTVLDVDTGGKYIVKKYTSKKRHSKDGTWEHEEIALLPLNPDYEPIIIPNADDGEFMVVAEFVKVLG
jgi:DUF2075 family protein/phage repressor protein C with HTH and peptisase S24 domain